MLFDFAPLTEQERYKLMVATVVPRPIAWVTSLDLGGRLNAAPFSFFNVMAGEPPVLVIGIGGRAPGDAKDTGNNIRRTGQFVVNLVSFKTAAAMNVTAIDFGPEINELAEAGLTPAACAHVRPPRIAESPVAFECERFAMLDLAPDRSLVIGRVLAAHIHDDCVLDAARCYIDTPKLDLIGRMHGTGWYARTTERFEVPRIPVAEWERRRAE